MSDESLLARVDKCAATNKLQISQTDALRLALRLRECRSALERIRDHNGVSYRFGDVVREIASGALQLGD